MSHFEPEVRDFMRRIVLSLLMGLIWLTVNMTLGIWFGLLFFGERMSTANLVYYIFLVLSGAFLVWWFIVTWKKRFPHG
jgi:hypothetical protein